MTTLSDDLPSLYDITGKITDCNTLLINRDVLRQLEVAAERYQYLRENQNIPADILMNHHHRLDAVIDTLKGQQ